jgi:hypothetical protein
MAAFHAGFNHSLGARQVLFDFITGKLLFCVPPPTFPDLSIFTFPASDVTGGAVDAALMEASRGAGAGGAVGASVIATGATGFTDVMELQDTDNLFALPLAKHKSKKASVVTSHRRRRKGERDPDPYGCHVPTDFGADLAAGARMKTRKDASVQGADDAAFVRVQRPYAKT